ncbi:glycosyltransferase family 4 protein [Flavobacterium hankyongi]|uniref:Glycosyltransferase family 4 protein n=2 Tax=Flavobacteriaceae TaxID=49546 RepID=A0ABP8ZZ95_9FLAO
MLQLIELFQEQDYKVVFASSAQESEFSFDLNSINIEKKNIELNNSSFDLYIKDLNPDIVLFDRFISEEQFGWRVVENCPNSIRILDTEDLHCLRYARQKAVKKSQKFELEDLLQEETAKREIASIYRCDLSLMVSDFEMVVLQDVFKIDSSLLFYLPMFFDVKNSFKPFKERKDFVFIGNFLHEPNYDAVLQLKSFWSVIKKNLPEVNLNIYGAYSSQKVEQLHNAKEGFLIKGRVDNALKVIENARVLLAPLRFGAGIKGKLLEAMQVGTPSITTQVGAEGITSQEEWNGFVQDNFAEFSEKAIRLYSDEKTWNEMQQKSMGILFKRFNKKDYESNFKLKIEHLTRYITTHRINNFTGNLLLQNQFASTKFMSKWIEEKNKG